MMVFAFEVGFAGLIIGSFLVFYLCLDFQAKVAEQTDDLYRLDQYSSTNTEGKVS